MTNDAPSFFSVTELNQTPHQEAVETEPAYESGIVALSSRVGRPRRWGRERAEGPQGAHWGQSEQGLRVLQRGRALQAQRSSSPRVPHLRQKSGSREASAHPKCTPNGPGCKKPSSGRPVLSASKIPRGAPAAPAPCRACRAGREPRAAGGLRGPRAPARGQPPAPPAAPPSAGPAPPPARPGGPRVGARARRGPAHAPPERAPRTHVALPAAAAAARAWGARAAQLSIRRGLSSARRERRRRRWDPGERSAASRLHLLHGSGDRRGRFEGRCAVKKKGQRLNQEKRKRKTSKGTWLSI